MFGLYFRLLRQLVGERSLKKRAKQTLSRLVGAWYLMAATCELRATSWSTASTSEKVSKERVCTYEPTKHEMETLVEFVAVTAARMA